ncbi:Rab3GAP regulatory subunit C-terminal [Trinorchestia longiramus]|nr:Rab3GAP regulatory subunit C-terminal [Trinorchestia longiramus]
MTSSLNVVAHADVSFEIQRWLCPDLSFEKQDNAAHYPFDALPDSAWADDWGSWDPLDKPSFQLDSPRVYHRVLHANSKGCGEGGRGGSRVGDATWLLQCKVAVSPTGDVMAIARDSKLCVLTGAWEVPEDAEERLVLRPSWRGHLSMCPGEISSVVCLPVSSLQRSSAGAPDFTSILVCTDQGSVTWLTQNGIVLLQKQFEEPGVPVLGTEVRTESDCLALLYPTAVVTIDTTHLTTLLRLAMHKLAKASAEGDLNSASNNHNPPLPCKKWLLQGRSAAARGVSVAGSAPESMYDALCQATLTQTPLNRDAIITGLRTSAVSLLTVGQEPYVALFKGRHDPAPLHVSDVAKQLASAVTSRVFGAASSWLPFMGGGRQVEEQQPAEKFEAGVPVPYRWCLPEGRRCGTTVAVSPDPRLAAVTDTFGRVVLVDVAAGYAVRIWKGYREAVVGWLSVSGSLESAQGCEVPRRTLLLVLYAPRRGLLEVWPAQRGPRVAAFNVPRGARLVYTGHGMLGSRERDLLHSVLLLCPDGALQRLEVPFHLLLEGRTTKRARDHHLFRSFKAAVKRGEEEVAAALSSQLQTSAARLQLLSFLAYCPCVYSHVLLHRVLVCFWPRYLPPAPHLLTPVSEEEHTSNSYTRESPAPEESVPLSCVKDKEARTVQTLLRRLVQLLNLHTSLYALHPKTELATTLDGVALEALVTELSHRVSLPAAQLEPLLERQQQPHNAKVSLTAVMCLCAGQSYSCDVWKSMGNCALMADGHHQPEGAKPTPAEAGDAEDHDSLEFIDLDVPLPISLKDHLSKDKKLALSRFLFGWQWSEKNLKAVHGALRASGMNVKSLLKLLLLYWQSSFEDEVNLCSSGGPVQALAPLPGVPESLAPNASPEVVVRLMETVKMAALLGALTSLAEDWAVCEKNERSSWWSSVRAQLVSWSCIRGAYFTALASRVINTKLENRVKRRKRFMQKSLVLRTANDERMESMETGDSIETEAGVHQGSPITGNSQSQPGGSIGELEAQGSNLRDNSEEKEGSHGSDAPSAAASRRRSRPASPASVADDKSASSQEGEVDLFMELQAEVKLLLLGGSNATSDTLKEWEDCSVESTEWAVVCVQLHRLLPLERLLNFSQSASTDVDISVKKMIDKGKGAVSEAVSQWLVRTGLSADALLSLTSSVDAHILHCKRLQPDYAEEAKEVEEEDVPEGAHWNLLENNFPQDSHLDLVSIYERVVGVSAVFPESMSLASLAASVAWESAAAWLHSTQDPALLSAAAALAAAVPNSHVRHGVCVMIWEKWVGPVLRRVCEAVERHAALPSASQCSSALKMPRHALLPFFAAAKHLLIIILESNVKCQTEKAHVPHVDSFWQHSHVMSPASQGGDVRFEEPSFISSGPSKQPAGNLVNIHESTVSEPSLIGHRFIDRHGDGRPDVPSSSKQGSSYGPKSLVEVAVLQRATSYDLVLLHAQLTDTLRLIAILDIKGKRPCALFSERSRCVLHKSLHVEWSQGGVDEAPSVTSSRLEFLTGSITLAIATLPDQPTYQEVQRCGLKEAMALGELWGVGLDHLYRFQVIELYSHGHDSFAEDAVRLVRHSRQLGQNLVLLAACRYKHLLDTSPRPVPLTINLGATISHWIKSLDANQLKNPSVPVAASIQLLRTAMRLLPDSSADHSKAENLLYAFTALQDSS